MKNFLKGVMLLVVVLLLSYFTAEYFGSIYNNFSLQTDDSWLSLTEQELIFIVGLPFAYVFFTTFLFQVFGGESRNKWTLWLLVPALLFFGSGDLSHIYLPIALGLLALGLAKVVNMIKGR